jgi:hypothetical protein
VERIKREGRFEEWKQTVATVQTETGHAFGQARWEAMRRMGYVGPDEERAQHAKWLAGEQAKTDHAATQVAQAQAALVDCDESFEAALATLALRADRQVENDWIMGHSALTRRARSADKDEPVRLTADDILRPSHGPSPSRAAAIRLQLFVHDPGELSKAMTAPVKKDDGIDSGRESELIEDKGLDEVRRLLGEVAGERCPKCGGYQCCAQIAAQGGAQNERSIAV